MPFSRALTSLIGRCLPLRLRDNLGQWLRRAPHETDFELFAALRDVPGLVVDVGANRGHAAISVLRSTRRLRVLSLEPNRAMRWSLLLVRLLHPRRFRFKLCGADYVDGTVPLHIPLGAGDLSAQASLDAAEFEKDYVRERLAADGHIPGAFRTVRARLRRLDGLDCRPDLVKIDVEGAEHRVLEGMRQWIAEFRPVLMIEVNNQHRWAPALQAAGYRFFAVHHGRLRPQPDWRCLAGLNAVCIHPLSHAAVSQRLWSLVDPPLELAAAQP